MVATANLLFFANSVSAQTPVSSTQATSRTVEDGGTGPYKALMLTEASLPTHTVFRPKDMSAINDKNKLVYLYSKLTKPPNGIN